MRLIGVVLEPLVVVVHFVFLIFLVAGGFLALRRRRVLPWHVGAVAWAAVSVAFTWDCPLTDLQQWVRSLAGRPPLAHGFIDTYVSGVIVPPDADVVVQSSVAGVVLVSWLVVAVDNRGRRTPVTVDPSARG